MPSRRARRLTALNRIWCWRVQRKAPTYPGHVIVRVWLESEGGSAVHLNVRVRFDDPWLNHPEMTTIPRDSRSDVFEIRPVTPKIVASMVEQANALGWDATKRGGTLSARWSAGVLEVDH